MKVVVKKLDARLRHGPPVLRTRRRHRYVARWSSVGWVELGSELCFTAYLEKTLSQEIVPCGFTVYSHSAGEPDRTTTPLSANLDR